MSTPTENVLYIWLDYFFILSFIQRFTNLIVFQSDTQIIGLKNLRPNTTFNLSATIFNAKGEKFSTPLKQIKTMHSYYKPEKIRNLNIKKTFKATRQVDVKISWEPGFGN